MQLDCSIKINNGYNAELVSIKILTGHVWNVLLFHLFVGWNTSKKECRYNEQVIIVMKS